MLRKRTSNIIKNEEKEIIRETRKKHKEIKIGTWNVINSKVRASEGFDQPKNRNTRNHRNKN